MFTEVPVCGATARRRNRLRIKRNTKLAFWSYFCASNAGSRLMKLPPAGQTSRAAMCSPKQDHSRVPLASRSAGSVTTRSREFASIFVNSARHPCSRSELRPDETVSGRHSGISNGMKTTPVCSSWKSSFARNRLALMELTEFTYATNRRRTLRIEGNVREPTRLVSCPRQSHREAACGVMTLYWRLPSFSIDQSGCVASDSRTARTPPPGAPRHPETCRLDEACRNRHDDPKPR